MQNLGVALVLAKVARIVSPPRTDSPELFVVVLYALLELSGKLPTGLSVGIFLAAVVMLAFKGVVKIFSVVVSGMGVGVVVLAGVLVFQVTGAV